MAKETLKTLLIKGIKVEFLEPLNLIGAGDVFHLPYDDVCELFNGYLRGISKTSKNYRELSSPFLKSATKIGVKKASLNL